MTSINLSGDEKLSEPITEPLTEALGEEEKYHSCLIISKSTLQSYHDRRGQRIELQFREENDRMDLYFIGYDKNNKSFAPVMLPTLNAGCETQKLKTSRFGVFYHDFTEEPLHNLLTTPDRDSLIDWYLQPKGFKDKGKSYVGYDVSSNAHFPLISFSINPCPPCTTTRTQ